MTRAISTNMNATDPNALRRLGAIGDDRERAEAVASQLESVFGSMMLKAMRATVPEGGLLGRGLGGKQWVEMLDEQLTQMNSLPRDPRFHEALVRQILREPAVVDSAMQRLRQGETAQTPGMAPGLTTEKGEPASTD